MISIIVPIYNVEKYIIRCLESIANQTSKNFECVFVDDKSPDNSVELISKFLEENEWLKSRTTIARHEKNKGLAAARNTGIEASHGDYIFPLDSDDYLSQNAIELMEQKIQETNADVVLSGFHHVYKTYKTTEVQDIDDNVTYLKELIKRERPMVLCAGAYKKDLHYKYDIWSIPGLNFGEDYVVKPRLIAVADKIETIPDALYNYVHYNENSFTNNFRSDYLINLVKAIAVITEFLNKIHREEEFRTAINYAKGKIKAESLVAWGINNGEKEDFNPIQKVFPDYVWDKTLPSRYKMILRISKLGPLPVRIFAKTGFWIKQIIKYLKNK